VCISGITNLISRIIVEQNQNMSKTSLVCVIYVLKPHVLEQEYMGLNPSFATYQQYDFK
jgi:hypothetical protein